MPTRHFCEELFRAGASGYVLKQSPHAELFRAIRAVGERAAIHRPRTDPPSLRTVCRPGSKRTGRDACLRSDRPRNRSAALGVARVQQQRNCRKLNRARKQSKSTRPTPCGSWVCAGESSSCTTRSIRAGCMTPDDALIVVIQRDSVLLAAALCSLRHPRTPSRSSLDAHLDSHESGGLCSSRRPAAVR